MDRIDYTFKFSTELLVLALSFIIIGVNFAGAGALQGLNNNNLLAKLLSYHSKYNKSLYAQQTQIRTVITDSGSQIIPYADAEVILAATGIGQTAGQISAQANSVEAANLEPDFINDNSIQKPNPGSVRTMILDQIKVYQTRPGDTLSNIADKYHVSVDTIMWANNLHSQTIKPGWDLQILPTSGVLHKVTDNDTLPDIARKFHADMNQIISYNNLAGPSDINPGDILIIPGGYVPAPPRPKPSIQFVVSRRTYYEPAPSEVERFAGPAHLFPWGECTWYVAQRRNVPWGGNANMWLYNAARYGAKIGRTPIAGAILVTSENRRYGHVAYVEQVDGDRFLVSEMNYYRFGRVDKRWFSLGDPYIRGFIY